MMAEARASRWTPAINLLFGIAIAVMGGLTLRIVSDNQRTIGGLVQRAENADKINDQQALDIRSNSSAIGILSSRMSAAEARQSGMQRALQDYGAQINAVRSRLDATTKQDAEQDRRLNALEDR